MSHRPLLRHTSVRAYAPGADWKGFNSVASLHAHTHHSREDLRDVHPYLRRLPVVGRRFTGILDPREPDPAAVDFSKGWWRPPISPRGVFESEAAHIDRCFRLDSIVSVTDHDDVTAGIELQQWFAARCAPISFEWTLPFREGFFHLGLHDLPRDSAVEWCDRLNAHTRARSHETVADALEALGRAGVLIVFNHPFWDLAGVGASTHARRLSEFLDTHQSRIHALEINGLRWRDENGRVRRLSGERGLPLISGGDRHGLTPNAVVNLTRARSFAEFAAEVRDGVSHIVVMPEYREHLAGRLVASAADALGSYGAPASRRYQWTDRVYCEAGGAVRPLSQHWPDGGPLWIRSAVTVFRIFTWSPVMRLWRQVLRRLQRRVPITPIPTSG